MAQLVAHLHGMQGVRGSSPLRSTNNEIKVGQECELGWFGLAEMDQMTNFVYKTM